MATCLLFTHTNWCEAPRLRHQTARLLLDAGHTVWFFEKPANVWEKIPADVDENPRFKRLRLRQLLHHQLRAIPALHRANGAFMSRQIKRRLRELDAKAPPVIVNFNYDFFFLRNVFPSAKIVSILNDDFPTMSRLPFAHHLIWALKRTCGMSDAVLTVSTPLERQLAQWSKPELFLPWSIEAYRQPQHDVSRRKTLVFWGYINHRIDVPLIAALASYLAAERPDFRIVFAGPIDGDAGRRVVSALSGASNIEFRNRCELADLPVDEILAALIPYTRASFNEAITMSNKVLQLLSRGFPLLISGMPEFIRKPFINRLDGETAFGDVLDETVAHFNDWQSQIAEFVAEQSPATRLKQLEAHFA
jgi:glycosyltransferase involved in cell wall biosynthesis